LGENKRVDRWIMRLQGLSFKIEKIAGSKNIIADGLSRAPPEIMEDPEDFAYYIHSIDSTTLQTPCTSRDTFVSIVRDKVCIGDWPNWVTDQTPGNLGSRVLYAGTPSFPRLRDDCRYKRLYSTISVLDTVSKINARATLPTLRELAHVLNEDPDCKWVLDTLKTPVTDLNTARTDRNTGTLRQIHGCNVRKYNCTARGSTCKA
jgi:hypothetical protein